MTMLEDAPAVPAVGTPVDQRVKPHAKAYRTLMVDPPWRYDGPGWHGDALCSADGGAAGKIGTARRCSVAARQDRQGEGAGMTATEEALLQAQNAAIALTHQDTQRRAEYEDLKRTMHNMTRNHALQLEAARMAGVHSVQEQTAVIVRAALELLEAVEGCEAFPPERMAAFRRIFGA